MAKNITRTITSTEIRYKALDGTTGSYYVEGEYRDIITLTKILAKEYRKDAFVTGYRITSALYEMPIATFIAESSGVSEYKVIEEV